MDKPFIRAADNNKAPILEALAPRMNGVRTVLEIGAGSGQHAVHFAAALAHISWQTSDCAIYVDGIKAWLDESGLSNLPAPIVLDVLRDAWPVDPVDAVYSANTAHFMPWAGVEKMFAGIERLLRQDGLFALYGPFNIDHRFTSAGNQRLDQWLREQDPAFGIRDLGEMAELGATCGLTIDENLLLPANNHLLIWRRVG